MQGRALLDQLNELALNTQMAGGPNPIAVLNLVDIVAKDLQKKETPEAYLIYALYDEDSNRYEVGKKILTRNAANQHEELEEKLAIKKNGYIETFVVNETSQDVWFDNFKILSQGSILVQETHYDPWGLELTGIGYEYAGVKKNKYLYNGKELIEDAGLQYYDYGARMYDPVIGRWGVVDPMADIAPDKTPYHFVSNNPINRIDPLGLTDYALNRKTGEVTQVGDSNDDPDRILRTNNKGDVKYKKNGEAKVAIGGIEQGILQDGQNFKTQDNIIKVGGEGQPSEEGVESFALKLSDYVGKEIAGAYFSNDGTDKTSHITIGRYINNEHKKAVGSGHVLGMKQGLDITGFFHTHPGNGRDISNSDRLVPSTQDLNSRDNALQMIPSLKFFLLTQPVNYGDKYPLKINYTTGYSPRR